MRSLSATLEAGQQASTIDALIKAVFTKSGEDTLTYTKTRIKDIIDHTEEPYNQNATIVLDNADGTLTALNLDGYQCVISYGVNTSAGEEYSACAPLWVVGEGIYSQPGKLTVSFRLYGQPNLLAFDQANDNFLPAAGDGRKVKDLIGEILGDSEKTILSVYDHAPLWNVTWDSEDALIDVHAPDDGFRIYLRGSRLSAVRRLLDRTTNVYRFEEDGEVHIFVPTTTGASYSYEYTLADGHKFWNKTISHSTVIPNYIVVESNPDDANQYSGVYSDGVNLPWEIRQYNRMKLASDAQAVAIATAIYSKYKIHSQAGSALVPMNVGAEVFDYIKITDSREGDTLVGNIGKIVRNYRSETGTWTMQVSLGGWKDMTGWWQDLENYPGQNPTDPQIPNTENIIADQLQHDIVTAEILNIAGIDGTTGRIVIADATDADAITAAINAYASTLLVAAKILVSGATTLADWRSGVDATYIDGGKLYTGTVTADQIKALTILAGNIAANAIESDKIKADAVTATKIDVVGLDGTSGRILITDATDANVVTAAVNTHATTLIAPGKVLISGAVNLDDWSAAGDATYIDGGKIYTNTIVADAIAAGVITATEIAALTITAGIIHADAIETDKINNGAVTQPKMGFNTEWFGDGDDGVVTIAANTNLARDMFYDSLTVDSGKILSTKGYRIFVKGTLTNNGTIENNGHDASGDRESDIIIHTGIEIHAKRSLLDDFAISGRYGINYDKYADNTRFTGVRHYLKASVDVWSEYKTFLGISNQLARQSRSSRAYDNLDNAF